jgi:hypothetical protein
MVAIRAPGFERRGLGVDFPLLGPSAEVSAKFHHCETKVSHLSSRVLDFAFGHPFKSLCCDLHRLLVRKA